MNTEIKIIGACGVWIYPNFVRRWDILTEHLDAWLLSKDLRTMPNFYIIAKGNILEGIKA